jgi:hypothetical protein
MKLQPGMMLPVTRRAYGFGAATALQRVCAVVADLIWEGVT